MRAFSSFMLCSFLALLLGFGLPAQANICHACDSNSQGSPDGDETICPTTLGPGGGGTGSSGCSGCDQQAAGVGLARWWVQEPRINLFLEDEPLGYQPARGKRTIQTTFS